MNKFPKELDKELLEHMDTFMKANLESKELKDITVKDFKLSDFKWREKKLKRLPEAVKKKRIELYLLFNSLFMEFMSLIEENKRAKSLASDFVAAKDMILMSLKQRYVNKQIESLPAGSSPEVKVARRKA